MRTSKIRTAQDVLTADELLSSRVFKIPCGGYVVASKRLIDNNEDLKLFRQIFRIEKSSVLMDGKLKAKYWTLPVYDPTDHKDLFENLNSITVKQQVNIVARNGINSIF
jgi:uncharacterized membrane protein